MKCPGGGLPREGPSPRLVGMGTGGLASKEQQGPQLTPLAVAFRPTPQQRPGCRRLPLLELPTPGADQRLLGSRLLHFRVHSHAGPGRLFAPPGRSRSRARRLRLGHRAARGVRGCGPSETLVRSPCGKTAPSRRRQQQRRALACLLGESRLEEPGPSPRYPSEARVSWLTPPEIPPPPAEAPVLLLRRREQPPESPSRCTPPESPRRASAHAAALRTRPRGPKRGEMRSGWTPPDSAWPLRGGRARPRLGPGSARRSGTRWRGTATGRTAAAEEDARSEGPRGGGGSKKQLRKLFHMTADRALEWICTHAAVSRLPLADIYCYVGLPLAGFGVCNRFTPMCRKEETWDALQFLQHPLEEEKALGRACCRALRRR